jgi:hypothetical protein
MQILMCNRGDNLFESSSSPSSSAGTPAEFERLVTRNKSIMDTAHTYVTKTGGFSKRTPVEETSSSPQPPKKRLKEAADADSIASLDLNTRAVAEAPCSDQDPSKQGVSNYGPPDVLSGRGGGTNLHEGNRYYRDLILSHRSAYDDATKAMKPEIAREIVQRIRERGGRFLRKDKDGLYYDIGDTEAKAKTSQALRHRTFELRNTKDPDRVKMNGRWKHGQGSDCGKESTASSTTSSSAKMDRSSPSTSSMLALQSLAPSLQESSTSSSTSSSSNTVDWNLLHEALRRHKLLEASRNSSFSAVGGSIRDDATYMAALAKLRQQETMLNLDRAIHEAEKRRYASLATNVSFPNNLSHNLPFARAGSTSMNPLLSSLNPGLFQVGSVARHLSLSNSLRDHSTLHSSFLPLGHSFSRIHPSPTSTRQPTWSSQEAKSPESPVKQLGKGNDESKES